MSMHSLAWALTQQNITPSEKLVLIGIANNTDANGSCFPDIETNEILAFYSMQDIQGVILDIQQLQEKGMLTNDGNEIKLHVTLE